MKKYTVVFVAFLCLILCLGISADGFAPRLVDGADVLSDSEEYLLLEELDEISERQQVDVVIHTVLSVGELSAMDYADETFEAFSYGMNGDRSCILLLISMEESDWHITTAGFGITAVTDVGLEYMADKFVPYLSDGDFTGAFEAYAEICDDFITRARQGDPFDKDDVPKEPFALVRNLIVCLLIGFIAAAIIVGKQKAALKSAIKRKTALEYTREDSLDITRSNEFFLYSSVKRSKKEERSGGSTTHKTNSGITVGGGGGKF